VKARLSSFRPFSALRLCAGVALVGLGLLPAARAQSDTSGAATGAWDISELLDRLPTMSPFGKLTSDSPFPLKYYARPRLGDLFHRDYMRLPIGARAQITDHVEVATELETYFTHGFGDAAGYGLSRYRVGTKYEEVMTLAHPLGWSVGTDFETPLSRPPMELTDGHRHLLPYVAFTHVLLDDSRLIGYSSVGLDFLSHSPLPSNFGRNQLHGNSTTFSTGVTRDFKRFRVALTGNWSTTSLLTNENHNLFSLRPDVLIPLTRKPGVATRTHLLLIFGGRAVHGPDGTELGVNGSVRVEFAFHAAAAAPK